MLKYMLKLGIEWVIGDENKVIGVVNKVKENIVSRYEIGTNNWLS